VLYDQIGFGGGTPLQPLQEGNGILVAGVSVTNPKFWGPKFCTPFHLP